jgi:SHS2 domain-containing protein
MGFQEIPHTADWALRVWADDLAGLLAEAARAMNSLAGVVLESGTRVRRSIDLQGQDAESLLVTFLTELVFVQEQEHLSFDQFNIRVTGDRLKAELVGAKIASVDKTVKAVTWHNLNIEKTLRGLEVEIVLDV